MSELNNWDDKWRNDLRANEELFRLVLAKDPDDDEEYWGPIGALQHRLPEILPKVADLLRSENEKARDSAGTILGQNRRAQKWDMTRCVEMLAGAVAREVADRPLAGMLYALGHLHDEQIIPIALPFHRHPCEDVRLAVTHALHGFEDPRAIQALIELSVDSDVDVRNWSTFYLGSWIDSDSPAIREALLARLCEDDEEIRGEAIVGLARRGDTRAVAPLLDSFKRLPNAAYETGLITDAIDAIADAAIKMPNAAWGAALLGARECGLGDQKKIADALQFINAAK